MVVFEDVVRHVNDDEVEKDVCVGAGEMGDALQDGVCEADNAVHVAALDLLTDVRSAAALSLAAEVESALRRIEAVVCDLGCGQAVSGDAPSSATPSAPGPIRALAGRFMVDSHTLLRTLRQDESHMEDAVRFEKLYVQDVSLVFDALARCADALDAQAL